MPSLVNFSSPYHSPPALHLPIRFPRRICSPGCRVTIKSPRGGVAVRFPSNHSQCSTSHSNCCPWMCFSAAHGAAWSIVCSFLENTRHSLGPAVIFIGCYSWLRLLVGPCLSKKKTVDSPIPVCCGHVVFQPPSPNLLPSSLSLNHSTAFFSLARTLQGNSDEKDDSLLLLFI